MSITQPFYIAFGCVNSEIIGKIVNLCDTLFFQPSFFCFGANAFCSARLSVCMPFLYIIIFGFIEFDSLKAFCFWPFSLRSQFLCHTYIYIYIISRLEHQNNTQKHEYNNIFRSRRANHQYIFYLLSFLVSGFFLLLFCEQFSSVCLVFSARI